MMREEPELLSQYKRHRKHGNFKVTSLHMKYELPELATCNLEKIHQFETEDIESQDPWDVF